jgi:hypothetical protein
MHNLKGPKIGREPVFLVVGSYFTHGPSNVTYMQIVRFNNSGRYIITLSGCRSKRAWVPKGMAT